MIKKIIFWFFGLVTIGFLLRHVICFKTSILEKTSALIAHPFVSVTHSIQSSIKTIAGHKLSYDQLFHKFTNLAKKHEELFQEYIKLRATIEFNENTKELLDFRNRYKFEKAILTKVIAQTMNASEHIIIVNKGSLHGIKTDMVAIHKLQILGRVLDVYPTLSKIMLMTDKRSKIAGFTNTTSAGGIVVGTNEPNKAQMHFVSHLSQIKDEDFIFSSGQGLIFPEGFCLGKISHHELKEKELYHSIDIEPLIDFEHLQYCLVATQDSINLF